MLQRRAEILASIRRFFAERSVLEVDTPALLASGATEPHLSNFITDYDGPGEAGPYYLQTSPETAMKRLLAAGSGPIYQICKAFRNGEQGRRHNPEFTLLEWYRPDYNHHALMDEVEALLAAVAGMGPARRVTYRALCQEILAIDPMQAEAPDLRRRAQALGVHLAEPGGMGRDQWLQLLFTHCIEPELGPGPVFVYDYPSSQAMFARVRADEPAPVAERFELYVGGVELANGFHELTDAREQARRLLSDRQRRRQAGLPDVPHDTYLLAALSHGLPDCSGVALGVDRLVALATGSDELAAVMAFPWDRI